MVKVKKILNARQMYRLFYSVLFETSASLGNGVGTTCSSSLPKKKVLQKTSLQYGPRSTVYVIKCEDDNERQICKANEIVPSYVKVLHQRFSGLKKSQRKSSSQLVYGLETKHGSRLQNISPTHYHSLCTFIILACEIADPWSPILSI